MLLYTVKNKLELDSRRNGGGSEVVKVCYGSSVEQYGANMVGVGHLDEVSHFRRGAED